MEFLLQLFAELVINNEESNVVAEKEQELEMMEVVETNGSDDFFNLMRFH